MAESETSNICSSCGGVHENAGAACPLSEQQTLTHTLAYTPPESGSKPASADEVGAQIGRFRLLSFLGSGGFASVYRAEDTRLGRNVAIKLLHSQLAANEGFVRRFNMEARAAARLRHPHIVSIYEVAETPDGRTYLVMALLEGRPLSELIAEHAPLPADEAASILEELASALDYVHGQGLVHRDIKPSNVMISDAGEVTLMDFGIARALDDQVYLTRTGQLMGTPIYVAPEQIDGTDVGPAADRYSLGILAYEMLAGRPPFLGTITSVIRDQLDTPPPPLAEFNPNVPEAAWRAIESTLAKNPHDRPSTAMDFVRQFRGEAVSSTPQTMPLPRRPRGSDPSSAPSATVAGSDETMAARRPQRGPVRRLPRRFLALAGGAALAVAILLWLFLAGTLTGGTGSLRVTSDPAGASVIVDGRNVGVTPLTAQKLAPGAHNVTIEKPTYLSVTRQEPIASRRTGEINAVLSSLPSSDLLEVKSAFVALNNGVDASGACRPGGQVTQVRAEQPFCAVVNLAQKFPGERDLFFEYQFLLLDASGATLEHSEAVKATLKKNEADRSVIWAYTFAAVPGDLPTTTSYLIRFVMNGNPVASVPVTLVR